MPKTNVLIKFIYLLVFICVIGFFPYYLVDFKEIFNDDKNFSEEFQLDGENIRTSAFWVESPIYIDGDATGVSAHNWTWVESQPWFGGGNGTLVNPYLIENITINGNNAEKCLEIRDSNVYFIINNCTFYNSSDGTLEAGIYLNNVDNGKFINNNVSANNGNGVYSVGSNNNIISGNNLSYNKYRGMYITSSSNDNTISGNIATYNAFSGISVRQSSNNKVSGNKATYNAKSGIYLYDNSNNKLLGNNASYNTEYGIYLWSSNNNTISRNNISNNDFYGILFRSNSKNNTISGNNASFNTRGIYIIENSINNTILGNNASYNTEYGIYLSSSSINMISGNNVNYNNNDGIYLSTSSNNTIMGNNASYNTEHGIYLLSSSNNNPILDNIIINNYQNGIILEESDNNTIHDNEIHDNINVGIYLLNSGTGSDNNTFYRNFFIGNGIHAIDEPSTNYWNISTIGNFWSNYSGSDADDDGIGDIPHNFTGEIDYLPICDDAAPEISSITLNPNLNVLITPPSFEVMITDAYLDSMWYTIVGSNQNITFASNGTIDQVSWQLVWNGLSHGESITIRFYANDTFEHVAYQDITVIKYDPQEYDPEDFPFWIIILTIIGLVAVLSGALVVKTRNIKKKSRLIEEKEIDVNEKSPMSLEATEQLYVDKEVDIPEYSLKTLETANQLPVGETKKIKIPIKPAIAPKLRKKKSIPVSLDIEKEEKAELEETESEVDIEKQKFICIVHKGPIIGANYLCPNCQTFYCVKCAKVLKDKGENCWSCETEFKI